MPASKRRRRGKKRSISSRRKVVRLEDFPDQSLHCSPTVKDNHLPGTCFDKSSLEIVKDAYNRRHRSESISEKEPMRVYNRLQQKLADKCRPADEKCWLNEIEDARVRKSLDKSLYVPPRPSDWKKNPVRWLSNFDIVHVLEQYEDAYPEFLLLGPTTLDYDAKLDGGECVDEELCHFSLRDLVEKDGKTKLSISFNLSKHDEEGTHWTTLFVDVDDKFVYYYDSALNSMPVQIVKIKDEILRQAKVMGTILEFHQNHHQHQKTNTECGMYSLFFTIVMLTGKLRHSTLSAKDKIRLFSRMNIPDDLMKQYRTIFFY